MNLFHHLIQGHLQDKHALWRIMEEGILSYKRQAKLREVANVIKVVPKSFMEKFGGTSALRVS
jgi:hypothetical protein